MTTSNQYETLLADVLDTSLRQSMLMGDGSPLVLLTRPIAGALLAATVLVLVVQLVAFRRGVPLGMADPEKAPAP